MNEPPKPKCIFIFRNAMLAVCDESGQQISELQGNIFESIRKLTFADLSALEEIKTQDINPAMLREAQERFRKDIVPEVPPELFFPSEDE